MKSAKKVTTRRAATRRRSPALSLSMRVERLEKAVIFPPVRATAKTLGRSEPFINLDSQGKPTDGDHVAVYQSETGLTWTAVPFTGNHAETTKAAAALDLLGHKDWRLPTIKELLSIIDYDRWDPAVNPAHFKGPYGWTWTSTLVKGNGAPSGYARFVSLLNGDSSWGLQDFHEQALAVRASQQLGLSV